MAVKSSSNVRTAGGFGSEPHRDPRRDAHRALAADEAAAQVVARLVGFEPTEHRGGSVGEHHLDREHVRRGDAGRETVRPAGVGRDVAADRARLLRRRVGRVVQAEMRDRPAEVEVEHSGLDPRHPLLGVDLEDVVELGGDDDERIAHRRGAAGEAGSAPPRHERAVVTCGDPHRLGQLATVAGKHTAAAWPDATPASRA